MGNTFLKKKFYSILASGTLSMIAVTVLLMSDSIIAGLVVGENGVAAISLVTPVYSLAAFFGGMISIGIPLLYNRAMGEFDKEKADRYFALGFTLAISVGLILFTIFMIFGDMYLSFYEPSRAVLENAKPYFFWYKFSILFLPVSTLMSEIIIADGDETISIIANLSELIGNILLSVVLSFFLGMAGIGLASFIGTLASVIICSIHFFRPGNSLKPGIYFSFSYLAHVIKYSAIDAGSYLFLAIFSAGLNRFITVTFGSEMLIISSVILFIKELQLVFDGIGEAIGPIMNIYMGEESYQGVKKCYKLAENTAIVEGLIVMVICFIAAPLVVKLYAVENPITYTYCVNGTRIMSLGFVPLSLLYLLTSYYLIADYILIGFVMSSLRDTVISLPVAVILGKLFGIYGLFAGAAISPLIAYVLSIGYIWLRYGRENCPLMLAGKEKSIRSAFYEFVVEPENVIDIQHEAEAFLEKENISKNVIFKTKLLLEELFMLIYEKNQTHGDKEAEVCAECTLILKNEGVHIIIKDDGVLFDIAREDVSAHSLAEFAVSGYMEKLKENKMYLTTMSYNRNTFLVKG